MMIRASSGRGVNTQRIMVNKNPKRMWFLGYMLVSHLIMLIGDLADEV